MKRVFKTKTFDRWARKVVSDTLLCWAAREIERGKLNELVADEILKEICHGK
jgi:hypothetical protein